jgi:hypothetical protein
MAETTLKSISIFEFIVVLIMENGNLRFVRDIFSFLYTASMLIAHIENLANAVAGGEQYWPLSYVQSDHLSS